MDAWQRLNPQLLRYFLAVAREGSLSAAGVRLHCVPSNVSARLRQLEQQLDIRLFQRQGQRLRVTAAGERLLPHAEHLEQLPGHRDSGRRKAPGGMPGAGAVRYRVQPRR